MTRLIFTFLIISLGAMQPVFAEEEAQDTVPKEEVKKLTEENKKKVEDEIKKETPITEWVSSENALLDRLLEQNKQTFFVLRTKHSTIRAIETVRRDIGNAVEACSKENPDLKEEINKRFGDWKASVNPILDDAKKYLDQELQEQQAFHRTDYDHIIKLNDKAYDFSDRQIKKTPVTEKKACEKLIRSMDRTEDNLISLLQDILIPEEVIRSRSERIQKDKETTKANEGTAKE